MQKLRIKPVVASDARDGGDIRRGRSELPAVDLAAVPGVEHQHDKPALVDGVKHR